MPHAPAERVLLVQVPGFEPVPGIVRVGGAVEAGPGDGEAAEELHEERFFDRGDLVDVGSGEGDAA